MASIEISIPELELGEIDNIERISIPRRPWHQAGPATKQCLGLWSKDGTTIIADLPQELIEHFEMVWQAHRYGRPGDDDEQTLADLREVAQRRNARDAARRAA